MRALVALISAWDCVATVRIVEPAVGLALEFACCACKKVCGDDGGHDRNNVRSLSCFDPKIKNQGERFTLRQFLDNLERRLLWRKLARRPSLARCSRG